MTFAVTSSFRTLTDGHWLWKLKELLVAAGWSVASSADGSSLYNASGDVHTAYATLDTANAWMRLRANASMSPRRELLLQNVSGLGIFRCLYSSDGTGFGTGGNATTRPTASDEQLVINASGSTRVLPNESAIYTDFVIGDASEQWSFIAFARDYGDAYPSAALFLDVLTETNPLDADGAVLGVEVRSENRDVFSESGNSSVLNNKSNPANTTGGTRGWYKKGLTGAAWVAFPPLLWGYSAAAGNSTLTSMSGTNRRWSMRPDSAFPELSCHYMRGAGFATEKGYKGLSRIFRLVPEALGPLRLNQDGTRLAIGSLSVPWDGTEPRV